MRLGILGMGFYLDNPTSCSGTNADYGYTNYTAVAVGSNSSFVQANSGPSTIQSSNSSVAVSYLSPQSTGNLNIVAVDGDIYFFDQFDHRHPGEHLHPCGGSDQHDRATTVHLLRQEYYGRQQQGDG